MTKSGLLNTVRWTSSYNKTLYANINYVEAWGEVTKNRGSVLSSITERKNESFTDQLASFRELYYVVV